MFQTSITKRIINSLPSDENPCTQIDYPSCVLDSIIEKAKEIHNCTIAFLSKKDSTEVCSNSVTLTYIKEIKKALKLKNYGDCKDLKQCKDVRYKSKIVYTNFIPGKPISDFKIYYAEFILEQLEDSYVYSFISIFSEIGGSLGVLIGLSCMTIVDFFIDIYKTFCKV